MSIEELLQDRSKLIKLFWMGLIASIVFIAIGVVWMMNQIL